MLLVFFCYQAIRMLLMKLPATLPVLPLLLLLVVLLLLQQVNLGRQEL
jgi:hypothetical protein